MIWNKKMECMSKEKMQKLQLDRLKNIVKFAYNNVPFYKKKFDDARIKPSDIRELKDIEKIPFTTKEELRKEYPYGMFAVPLDKIVEIHTTSGSTGKPIITGYTLKDIELWSEVMARCHKMAGITKKDIVQISSKYGLFTGGLGHHYGARKVKASIIPISSGNTKLQAEIMKDLKTTVLIGPISYLLHLTEKLKEEKIDINNLKLKGVIFGAETWTENMRKEVENRLNVTALNIYGLAEIIGPGVAHECMEKNGLHIFEDYFYPEIISPETLEKLEEGEKGELILTTLEREGTPMIRFRTRDITSLKKEKCSCGRNLIKMSRIIGRSDEMIKIKGIMVFPSKIEKILLDIKGIEPHYKIIIRRVSHLDKLVVHVEPSMHLFYSGKKLLNSKRKEIKKRLEEYLLIKVNVKLVRPKSLPRFEGKAKRIFDMRNI